MVESVSTAASVFGRRPQKVKPNASDWAVDFLLAVLCLLWVVLLLLLVVVCWLLCFLGCLLAFGLVLIVV